MNSATIREDAQHRLHSQLLQFLPKELADELIRHHTSVTYHKDSIIFLQGSPADLMFWIMSGLVKLYCPRPDGNRTLVKLCGPGMCWATPILSTPTNATFKPSRLRP